MGLDSEKSSKIMKSRENVSQNVDLQGDWNGLLHMLHTCFIWSLLRWSDARTKLPTLRDSSDTNLCWLVEGWSFSKWNVSCHSSEFSWTTWKLGKLYNFFRSKFETQTSVLTGRSSVIDGYFVSSVAGGETSKVATSSGSIRTTGRSWQNCWEQQNIEQNGSHIKTWHNFIQKTGRSRLRT